MKLRNLLASGAAALVLLTGTASVAAARAPSGHSSDQLTKLRTATAKFHSIALAQLNGYAMFTDINGLACIDMPGMGGMGVHWVNGTLVGDPALVPNHPEAFVYAPAPDGTLQLAAVEYIVVKSAWDASHKFPPKLFGHTFNFTDAPNRYNLPPFYSLHVWVWKHNPAGTFAMWNPAVHCPSY
jgi:hypothetical protein